MPSNNAQEALKAFASLLDDFVREAVGEDLAGEGRDVDSRALALEDVTKGFKVGIAPSYNRVAKFEGGDVGLRAQLVLDPSLHNRPAQMRARGHGIPCKRSHSLYTSFFRILEVNESEGIGPEVIEDHTVRLRVSDFNLQETLWNAVHFLDLPARRETQSPPSPRREQEEALTDCCGSPMRGSSNTLVRAKGETVAIVGGRGRRRGRRRRRW